MIDPILANSYDEPVWKRLHAYLVYSHYQFTRDYLKSLDWNQTVISLYDDKTMTMLSIRNY